MTDIIQHAISLSSQKDSNELDCCLATISQALFPGSQLALYKTNTRTLSSDNPEYQLFSYESDLPPDICYNWEKDLELHQITDHENFEKCISTDKPVIFQANRHEIHLIIPFSYHGINHGVIEVIHSRSDESKQNDFINLTSVYENLYTILNDSERDQLTGLYNRKTFDKKLNHLLYLQSQKQQHYQNDCNRTLQQNTNAWLVAIDIDHFKRVNDEFGHLYGDEVLLRLAQLMQQSFRRMDQIFRFGGEEFILILEPTTLTHAQDVLDRFRQTVEQFDFPLVGQVTISTGFSALTSDHFPTEVMDFADKALYLAKENGRNRVYNYERLIEQGLLTIKQDNKTSDIDLF